MLSLFEDVDALRKILDQALLRGLRSLSSQEIMHIAEVASCFQDAGAEELSNELVRLHHLLSEGASDAAECLLSIQSRLDVFERLMTLRLVVGDILDVDDGGGVMKLPSNEAPEVYVRLLQEVTACVALLYQSGLTAANKSTQDRLSAVWKESSRLRLLRLASALRIANEEVKRFVEKDEHFSLSRLSFFLRRARIIAHRAVWAIQNEKTQELNDILASPQSQPIKQIDFLVMGVSVKVSRNVFCAFEFHGQDSDGSYINWSCVYPIPPSMKTVSPNVLLNLKQKQGFKAVSLLEHKYIHVDQAHETNLKFGTRLQLSDVSEVSTRDRVGQWPIDGACDFMDLRRRLQNAQVGPLDLPTEFQEYLIISEWKIGEEIDVGLAGRKSWQLQTPYFNATMAISDDEGSDFRIKRINELRLSDGDMPLYVLLYFERGRIIVDPLTLFENGIPEYLTITKGSMGARDMLRVLKE